MWFLVFVCPPAYFFIRKKIGAGIFSSVIMRSGAFHALRASSCNSFRFYCSGSRGGRLWEKRADQFCEGAGQGNCQGDERAGMNQSAHFKRGSSIREPPSYFLNKQKSLFSFYASCGIIFAWIQQ